jgi:CheY-like chemotaxis protein
LPRVLIIDDEPIICSILRRELEVRPVPGQPVPAGACEVDTSTSGAEALTLLRGGDYALILCDLMMRGLSGFELIEILGRETPHLLTRLVIITGRTCSADDERRFGELGVRLLYKPFRTTELLALVLPYLDPTRDVRRR